MTELYTTALRVQRLCEQQAWSYTLITPSKPRGKKR
jgi:hypothetical protein